MSSVSDNANTNHNDVSHNYSGVLPSNTHGRWIVELREPDDQQWRLRASIDLPQPVTLPSPHFEQQPIQQAGQPVPQLEQPFHLAP